jgi:hypothetical protein
MARELLKRDSLNRPIRKRKLEEMIADMKANRWMMNGETIKIGTNGDVLDGQHRLNACVLSNSAFTCIIVYDLPKEIFETIDSGTSRTLADLLYLESFSGARVVASAAPYVYWWKNLKANDRKKFKITGGIYRPARNDLFHYVLNETKTKLWDRSAKQGGRVREVCPRSVGAAAHYLMSEQSRQKADAFFEMFATGAGMVTDKHPILTLRSRLIKDKNKTVQTSPTEKFMWVMRAWQAFREGEQLTRIKDTNPSLLRKKVESHASL